MPTSTLMLPTSVYDGFPVYNRENEIIRDSLLDAIESAFQTEQIVILQGKTGMGKSVVSYQYATMRHPEDTISLFIKTSTPIYSTRGILVDLCSQAEVVHYGHDLDIEFIAEASEAELLDHWQRTLKAILVNAHRNNRCLYFVIDGTHHIAKQDYDLLAKIFHLFDMAFSNTKTRFLISYIDPALPSVTGLHRQQQPIYMIKFTREETARYLANKLPDPAQVEFVYSACRGFPRYLASVRSILDTLSADQVAAFLNDLPDYLPDLFERRWATVPRDETLLHMLAVLAFDLRSNTYESIASLFGSSVDTVKNALDSVDFIVASSSNELAFESSAFQNFAQTKLPYNENDILFFVLSSLQTSTTTYNETNIPIYLRRLNQFRELVNYLSVAFFGSAIQREKSISYLQKMTKLGIDSATQIGEYTRLFNFVLQKSVIDELAIAQTLRFEVEALTLVGNHDAALALAQSATLVEDRLQLLAILTRARRTRQIAVEPIVTEQILQLYEQIDVENLGRERAVHIAFDLLYAAPKQAVALVERSLGTTGAGASALDFAFAGLSVSALAMDDAEVEAANLTEDLRLRIKDPQAQRFAAEFSVMFGHLDGKEIIQEVEQVEDIGYRIRLLRRWIVDNRSKPDVINVMDYAFGLAIKTTEYPASTSIFRDIARPVPLLGDTDNIAYWIQRFDDQRPIVERLGPTIEVIRLELLLVESELKLSLEKAKLRINSLRTYIREECGDLATETEALGRLLALFAGTELMWDSDDMIDLHSEVEERFKECFDELLTSTADHYILNRGTIRGLARTRPDMAKYCAQSLNILPRREAGLQDFVEVAARAPRATVNLPLIREALNEFQMPDERDSAILTVVTALSTWDEIEDEHIDDIRAILALIPSMSGSEERTEACAVAYAFLVTKKQRSDELVSFDVLQEMEEAWSSIDVPYSKIELAYRVATILAPNAFDVASDYVSRGQQCKIETAFSTSNTALAFHHLIRLAIRCFRGILSNRIDVSGHLAGLERLIQRVRSRREQIEFWTDISLLYFATDRHDEAVDITDKYIRPLIESLPEADVAGHQAAVGYAATALYLAHAPSSLRHLESLPLVERDVALLAICEFKITGHLPADSNDEVSQWTGNIAYTDLLDLCSLTEQMSSDSYIAVAIDRITTIVASDPRNYTKGQKAELKNRLTNLVNTKLPSRGFIQHQGYLILCLSYIDRLVRYEERDWKALVSSARDISNAADRAFVLSSLVEIMPNRFHNERMEIIKEVKEITRGIPSVLDRISRYRYLGTAAKTVDRGEGKAILSLGWAEAIATDSVDLDRARRKLIDAAQRLSPELAQTFVQMADTDPARRRIGNVAKRQLDMHQLKSVLDKSESAETLSEKISEIGNAARRRLISLNAGRTATVPYQELAHLMGIISRLPFHRSYHLLAYIVQNNVLHYAQNKQEARKILLPLFSGILEIANFMEQISRSSVSDQESIKHAATTPSLLSDENTLVVEVGQREVALEYLKRWVCDHVTDYLKICDPYLGPDDVAEILFMVSSAKVKCHTFILTSRAHQGKIVTSTLEDQFMQAWRDRYDDAPPPVTIIVAGNAVGKLPDHDRFWVTKEAAITIGTSFNYLGNKATVITKTSSETKTNLENRFSDYNPMRFVGTDEQLTYKIFTLS